MQNECAPDSKFSRTGSSVLRVIYVEAIKRSIDWAVVVASAAIVLAIAYGIWCDVIDGRIYNPVLEFGTRFSGPTHLVEKETYKPGEMVYANVLFHKNRAITGVIQWALINKELKQFPPRPGSLPVGIFNGKVRVEPIPLDANQGEHWFCGTVNYKINWLANLSYNIWTDKFEVVRP
jgi:hypothetical protein